MTESWLTMIMSLKKKYWCNFWNIQQIMKKYKHLTTNFEQYGPTLTDSFQLYSGLLTWEFLCFCKVRYFWVLYIWVQFIGYHQYVCISMKQFLIYCLSNISSNLVYKRIYVSRNCPKVYNTILILFLHSTLFHCSLYP